MKKHLITILILFLSIATFSQENRQQREDKIKALKIAYITENLDFTTSEAEKFWPIYNTFEEQQQELRKASHEKRRNINFETISEMDAQKLIEEMEVLNSKRNILNTNYMIALRKVLSAKKILLLKNTEESFKRKIFEEFRKRKGKKNQ